MKIFLYDGPEIYNVCSMSRRLFAKILFGTVVNIIIKFKIIVDKHHIIEIIDDIIYIQLKFLKWSVKVIGD